MHTHSQEKLQLLFINANVPFDNSENTADVLTIGKKGLPQKAFDCISIIEQKVAQIISEKNYDERSIWEISPELGLGRAKLPILLAPQKRTKHEFDVFEHIERTAWAIAQFHRTIFPKLPEDLCRNTCIENIAMLSLTQESPINEYVIAAYLHDCEKIFKSRNIIDPKSPYKKTSNKAKKNALLKNANGKDYDPTELIMALLQKPDQQTKITAPKEIHGILNTLQLNNELIISLFKIYKIVDKTIILHAEMGMEKIEEALIKSAYNEIMQITSSPTHMAMGILIMAADNFAQGLPPMVEPLADHLDKLISEQITAQNKIVLKERKRNYEIVVAILRKVVNELN